MMVMVMMVTMTTMAADGTLIRGGAALAAAAYAARERSL